MILNFLLFAQASSELVSVIVYSELTPSSLVSELSLSLSSFSRFYISMAPYSDDLIPSLLPWRINAVFDYTYSIVYSHRLMSSSASYGVLYFSNREKCEGKWNFCLHPPPLAEAKAIKKLLDFLGWHEYFLLTSEKKHSQTIFQYLSTDPLSILSTSNDQESYDHFVGRTVKPTGKWKVVALTESQGALKVLQALKNMRIFKERCGLIFSSRAVWEKLETGTIIVSEEGLEFADSKGDFEFKAVIRALDVLDQARKDNSLAQNESLRRFLEQNTGNHIVSSTFSILNYTPDRRIAGNITDTVNIETIVFPGNVTEFNTSPPVISMSANLASHEQDGSFNLAAYVLNLGIVPMVQIINEDPNLLSNFELEIHGTYCAAGIFNYSYVSECMKASMDKLGTFYIDNAYDGVVEGNLRIFRENGLAIPHTTFFALDIELYDKEKYPELYVTNAYSMYQYSIIPYILNSFRWKQILVYFEEDVSPALYDAFIYSTRVLEIEIINNIMILPFYYDDFAKTNEKALNEAFESNCRIFVLLLHPIQTLLFIESMYNLGLRRGDTVFIFKDALSGSIDLESTYGHNREKVLELVDGSLTLTHNEYIGEYGKQLEKQISDLLFPFSAAFTCFQVDSLLLGAHTIDMMLRIGRNYDDPLDMNYFMRQQLFTGCSGTVSIDSGGNGRNEISFSLRNFYVEEQGWVEEHIGHYIIGIMTPLKIDRQIMWPNGASEIPEAMKVEPECGIEESDIRYVDESILICVIGTVMYSAIVIIVSFIIWFTKYRFQHQQVGRRRELMFEDGVEIAIPFIEACESVVLGPGESVLNLLTFILPVHIFLDSQNGTFWRAFYATGAIALIWSICIFFAISRLDQIFPRDMKNFTRYIGITMLPLFSKIAFIPVLWILLRVFECKEGVGSNASDAFLKNDCHVWCWKGFHLTISIVCVVTITFYTILAAISGTVYDMAMDHVSIKTNTFFSVSKTLFKAALVFVRFHLYERNEFLFGIVFLCLCIAWTGFVFKIESYNFERLVMWQKISCLGACVHLSIAAIRGLVGFDYWIIVLLDLLIVLVLAIAGFVIQYKKYAGCFYKREGRNFAKLLKFAYTSKMKARELTEHELDYRNNEIIRIERES